MLVAGVAAFSLLVSLVWQQFYNEKSHTAPIVFTSPDSLADAVEPEAPEEPLPEEEEEAPPIEAGPADYPYALAEVERVTSDYFNDAAFVGDSITDGLKLYETIPNATVISHTGINLSQLAIKQVIETDDGRNLTFLDALKEDQPAKIYIMMGANDIGFVAKEKFISMYGQFIDAVREQHPHSTIYVQAMFPVTASKSNSDPRYANSKIDEYNLALMELAREKRVYFIYTSEALKNEDGALPEEASPKDGMHFGPSSYTLWIEYLKLHTAPQSN